MVRRTVLVVALTDPARIVPSALWDRTPEEVIAEPHPDIAGAVLAEHYNIILKVTQELPPKPEHRRRTARPDPSGGRELREEDDLYVCRVVAENEEEALQWAIRILTSAHKDLSAAKNFDDQRRGPRLQCGIVLVHKFPKILDDLLPWAEKSLEKTSRLNKGEKEIDDLLELTTGGRIVCSGDVHTALRETDLYHYYGWQSAARRPVRHTSFWLRLVNSVRWAITTLRRRFRHGMPWECLYDDTQVLLNAPFERVFAAEVRGWIKPSRTARKITLTIPFPERPHVENGLVGLALSGGGMRSGVFSVGVMQSLARHGFLADVDYMSTVSGGGYAGSALSALAAESLEYEGLGRLGTRKDNFPFTYPRPDGDGGQSSSQVHGNESPALKHVRENAALYGTKPGLFDAKTWIIAGRYLTSTLVLWAVFLLPAVTVIGLIGIAGHNWVDQPGSKVADVARNLMIGAFGIFAVLFVGYVASSLFPRHGIKVLVYRVLRASAYLAAGAAFLLAVFWIFGSVTTVDDLDELWSKWLLILGVLSPLVVFGVAATLSNVTDEPAPKRVREVVLPIIQAGPLAAGLLILMLLGSAGVYGFDKLVHAGDRVEELRVAAGVTAATGAVSTVIALSKLWQMKQTQALAWRAVLAFGGYIVLGFAIAAWSWLLWYATDDGTSWERLTIGGVVSGGMVLLMLVGHPLGRWILNYFSLHRIYAPMLAKTWVIAAKPRDIAPMPTDSEAAEKPRWTQVWSRDDIQMSNLRPCEKDRPTAPYHLICTTLNLPGSTSTKLLDRKADSFVIAPLKSGSALTRWIETKDHDELDKIRLSQAAAVSGAAIAPNAGEHTSRTFSIMATLVNARLGRWLRNPRPSQNATLTKWLTDTPLLLYWKEMFGLASHNDGQIYLSDGGHFENLGLYELFRRRCKYIIAVSADVGPLSKRFDLGNIGNALRLARVDFGVQVDLGEFKPLVRDSKTGYVGTYYAAGELTYPCNPASKAAKGVLIFIKTGLCEDDLSLDVAEYWMDGHPAFPYDSTLNQQYNQPIFESYRQLGYLAASAVCNDAGCDSAGTTRERFEAVRKAYDNFRKRPKLPSLSDDGETPGAAVEAEVVRQPPILRVSVQKSKTADP